MKINKLKVKDSFVVLYENDRIIKFIKEETDPMCLRASIGGNDKKGYYCTYRGDDLNDIELMLTRVLNALKTAKKL